MSRKNAIKNVTLASFDTAGLTAAFQPVNAGLSDACSILRIINDSNVDVIVSYDATNDHDYVRAGESIQIDSQANAVGSTVLQFSQGLVVSVRGGGAGVGNIYVAGYFQPQ